MINLLLEFIGKCNNSKATPSEREIESFLNCANEMKYKNTFIKWCFYYWEDRSYNPTLLEMQLETLD